MTQVNNKEWKNSLNYIKDNLDMNKPLVLVIGELGCGKSAVINLINGATFKSKFNDIFRTYEIDVTNDKSLAPIKHGAKTDNFNVKLYKTESFNFNFCEISISEELSIKDKIKILHLVWLELPIISIIWVQKASNDMDKEIFSLYKKTQDIFKNISFKSNFIYFYIRDDQRSLDILKDIMKELTYEKQDEKQRKFLTEMESSINDDNMIIWMKSDENVDDIRRKIIKKINKDSESPIYSNNLFKVDNEIKIYCIE